MSQTFHVTASFSDGTVRDGTSMVTSWTTSDSTMVSLTADGTGTVQTAGHIWGSTIGITGTAGAYTATGSILAIASDSSSFQVHMPQFDDHWRALGLSPWGSYWGMQEPSGSNDVSSGSLQMALTASAAGGLGIAYQQVPPGWLRGGTSISGTGGTNGPSVTAPSGTGPSYSTQSVGWLGYIAMSRSTSLIPLFGGVHTVGASVVAFYTLNNSCVELLGNGANGMQLVGPLTHEVTDRVHPFLLVRNITSGDLWACTDVGIVMSGNTGPIATDGPKGLGRTNATAPSASLVYMAMASGSIVENLCSVSASADFLSRLGWTVSWKDCPTDSGSIRCPFLPDHWKSLGLQPWTATWNFQESAGPFDTFDQWQGYDDNGWRLNVAAIDGYRYPLSAGWTQGWNRRGYLANSTSNHGQAFRSVVYGPPPNFNPTGSFAGLAYLACLPAAATPRQIMGIGGSSAVANEDSICMSQLSATGQPIIYCGAATATGSQNIADSKVHPVLLVYDTTNLRVKLYTDLEVLTGSFTQLQINTSFTASFAFGGLTNPLSSSPVSGVYVYGSFCTGTFAEQFSDDGTASSFLKKLGWPVGW